MGLIDFINNVLSPRQEIIRKAVPTIDPFSIADRGGLPKAYIPNFLYRPPFGYPRYINVPNIRRLAAMPYVEMAIRTIIAECQAVPWDIVVNKDDEFSEKEIEDKQEEIKEIKNFFRNPNTNKESFEQIDSKVTRDVLEIDSGVMVKIFNKAGEMVEIVSRDGGLFTKNPDVYGMITNRDDIIFAQMAETYDEREGKLPPGYIGANDMREKAAYFQYGWMASGRPVPFGKREVVWFEQNVRSDDIYGRSPVENLLKTIQMLIYAIDNNLEYFTENSIPKGIIGMEGSNAEEIEAFKQTWREQQRKLDEYGNWRKVFWNPPIVNRKPEFEKIEWSAAELQLIEQQKWFSQLVWASFGVTPSELGYTENTNNATEIVQSRVFKRKAINPLLKMKEWKYNHEILVEWRESAKKKAIATHMQETESEYVRNKIKLENNKEVEGMKLQQKAREEFAELKSRYEEGEINEYSVAYLKAREEVDNLAKTARLPYHGIEFKYLMFDVDEETKKWTLYKMQLESKAKTINDILKAEGETPVDWGNQPADYTPGLNVNGLQGFGTQNGNRNVGTKPGTEQDTGQKPFADTNSDKQTSKQGEKPKRPAPEQEEVRTGHLGHGGAHTGHGEGKSGAMEDYHFQLGNLSPDGQEYFKKCIDRNLKMGMNKEEAEQNAWSEIRNMGLKDIETKPFAGYSDFADCVAKNKDKDDPDAYCATIMRAVEEKDMNHFQVQRDEFDRAAKENGVNSESLRKGFEVEQEHLKTVNYDRNVIMKIAIDHLREDPNYYTKLEEIEKKNEYDVIYTSEKIDQQYIGMNFYAAKEMGFEFKYPENTILIYSGQDEGMKKETTRHEIIELNLMKKGMKYQEAHNIAEKLQDVEIGTKAHLNFDQHNENFDPSYLDTQYTSGIKKKNPLILDIDEKPTEEKLIGAIHFILEENEKNIVKLIEQEVRPNKVGEIKSLQDIINSIKNILGLSGIKDVSDAVIMSMFQSGWDKTEKQLDRNLNLNREAIDFIKKYTFENILGMTNELIDDLRQELERGMIEGEGAFKLTERVKKVFDSSKTRAEAIARTETNRAENQGRLLAFKESGEEYEKKWIAHLDERTSLICRRLNGKTTGMHDNFKDGQTGWEGVAPPAHVNCRSQVVFVPKGK